MLAVGDHAPDFCLPSTKNADIALEEFAGMPVVLYFYPKDGSVGCKWEARSFRAQFEILSKRKVTILGVSRDNVDDHCEFQGKEGLPFELLSDVEGNVHDDYHACKDGIFGRRTRRCTYLIGPDQKIAKVYKSVNPSGHAKTVVLDVERIGQEQGWFKRR